jgi:hypothetical protein
MAERAASRGSCPLACTVQVAAVLCSLSVRGTVGVEAVDLWRHQTALCAGRVCSQRAVGAPHVESLSEAAWALAMVRPMVLAANVFVECHITPVLHGVIETLTFRNLAGMFGDEVIV